MLLLCAAVSIQCSDDNGDQADEVSLKKPNRNTGLADDSDNAPANVNPPGGDTQSVFWVDNGFANDANARLVVNSINSFQVTEGNEFLYGELLGGGGPGPAVRSNTTEVFLDYETQAVYVFDPQYQLVTLLYFSDAWGFRWLNAWDLQLAVLEESGEEEEITISGTGRGSHLYDCWTNEKTFDEFMERAEVAFEFTGRRKEGTNDFEGPYALSETSLDQTCMLLCSGTMTLERD